MSDEHTPENPARDGAFDDWLDAVAAEEGYYLACEAGHGWLPPRRVCHACGGDLHEEPLPETGTVDSFTVVHVPTPAFAEEAPYATVIASFGPVRVTGICRAFEDLATGETVTLTVGERAGDGDRLVLFER